jgi:hypothetical protein
MLQQEQSTDKRRQERVCGDWRVLGRTEEEGAIFRRWQRKLMWMEKTRSEIESHAHVRSYDKIDEGLPQKAGERRRRSRILNNVEGYSETRRNSI